MLIQKFKKIKNIRKLKRSQILLIGSLLVFFGIIILSYSELKVLKEAIYENVRLSMFVTDNKKTKKKNKKNNTIVANTNEVNEPAKSENNSTFKYNYIGYLEIPKIGFKRGFVEVGSKYNDIKYNITISEVSNMPDVEGGNFVIYAHSGDAYISFFANLYKLEVGDYAYIYYGGQKYTYQLVKVTNVPKTGSIKLDRPNVNIKELTLITCTKDSDTEQTIYYFDIR